MSYVTTLGMTLTPTTVVSKTPVKAPVKKPSALPLPLSVVEVIRAGRVTQRPTPPVAPSVPDASFAPPDNSKLMMIGGAVTVGLLLIIALRR